MNRLKSTTRGCVFSLDAASEKKDKDGEKEEAVNCPNRSNSYHKCTDYCKSRWSKEGVAMMMSSQQQQQAGKVRV